jgi:hypothetical protein
MRFAVNCAPARVDRSLVLTALRQGGGGVHSEGGETHQDDQHQA